VIKDPEERVKFDDTLGYFVAALIETQISFDTIFAIFAQRDNIERMLLEGEQRREKRRDFSFADVQLKIPDKRNPSKDEEVSISIPSLKIEPKIEKKKDKALKLVIPQPTTRVSMPTIDIKGKNKVELRLPSTAEESKIEKVTLRVTGELFELVDHQSAPGGKWTKKKNKLEDLVREVDVTGKGDQEIKAILEKVKKEMLSPNDKEKNKGFLSRMISVQPESIVDNIRSEIHRSLVSKGRK
jgi:hypothetical protein